MLLRHRAFIRRGLLNSLTKYESALKEKVAQKADSLVSFKQHLKQDYALPTISYPEVPLQVVYKKSSEDIEQAVRVSKEFFVKKVSHAYRD